MFSPGPELSRRCGWIVDAGKDFPDDLRDTVREWGMRSVIREDAERMTTRGWNSYVDGERGMSLRVLT